MKRSFLAVSSILLFGLATAGSHDAGSVVDPTLEPVRYRIVPEESSFMIHALRGGLAWFKGHSHEIAVRDFAGTVELTPAAINPASLEMTIRTSSLEETSDVFTPQQKAIIKKELDEIVLESGKYPEITFRSTEVSGEIKNGRFEANVGGKLTLHGVTRHVIIPTSVTVETDKIRAKGEFELDRKKFNVNATNAFHGLVRVKHGLKFTFDIIARQSGAPSS